MKKTLALLLVASLLLAGCTELTDAVDEAGEEILNIEVDEEIALERVEDFLTVDESESFGITVMYEIDMSQMDDGSGMLEVSEDAIMTMEMTEAWSPDGYHSSAVMGMDDGDMTISSITSMTHVGNTMYVSIGYEMDGELGSDASQEEQMMLDMMPEVEHFSMTTTTTHTEVIAAMAEASEEDSEDMDPMAFLEMIEMIEEYGTFTPADSVDGLQMFDVAIDMAAVMDGEVPTPEEAITMCDADNNQGISWSEFIADNCDETDSEDMTELEALFNDADTDMSGELTVDEVQAFIDSVTEFYQESEDDSEMDDDMIEEMPGMQVAFTSTGDIEYFSMEMDGTEMMMYILTDDRVNALFTDLDAGETVALPFSLSYDMNGGMMDDFVCDDGEVISSYQVNDGWEDCTNGEDEDGETHGGDENFVCNDGSEIPMYWVDDGFPDCPDGEDESDSGDDGGDEDYIFYCSNDGEAYAEGMGGILCPEGPDVTPECPNGEDCVCIDVDGSCSDGDDDWGYLAVDEDDSMDYSTIYDGCTESTDPADSYYECWMNDWLDSDGNILDSDGYEMDECTELADGSGWECLRDVDSLIDDMVDEWMAFMDADGDGNITWDEHDTFIIGEDGWDSEEARNATMMTWSEYDSDLNGGLDEFELAGYLEYFMDELMAEEYGVGPTFICGNGEEIPFEYVNDGGADCADGADEQQYDSDGNEINWFDCMDGSQVWIAQVNDGNEDCPDGEDEMPAMSDEDDMGDGGSDDDGGMDMGDSDEIVMYVTSEMDFHFEGDLSDYKIELATCESDYDMETGEETMTCTTVMSVAIADAGMDSDIMFHDADSSGTLSVGDMIHIGEVAEAWDEVRLYSISADAYSDENPMHDAPGFTGLVGMLALLGAAFIRRNE